MHTDEQNEPETPETVSTDARALPLLPPERGARTATRPKLTVLPRPTFTPRRPTLSTATDCKREIGKIYRLCRHKLLPLEEGTKLTFIVQAVAKIIENSDQEARLKAIEQALEEKL
jgi:hypothetical protein